MIKGMTTCKVCGRDFPLISEEHYVARDTEKKGIVPALTGQEEATLYDVFDCPHYGCQNIMQERKQEICPCDSNICDECECTGGDKEEEEADAEVDHDGCKGCAHENLSGTEEPCASCMHNYRDNYTLREE